MNLDDLRVGRAEPQDEAAVHEVEAAVGLRHTGGMGEHVEDARPISIVSVLAARLPHLRHGVEAVRLWHPHDARRLSRSTTFCTSVEVARVVDVHRQLIAATLRGQRAGINRADARSSIRHPPPRHAVARLVEQAADLAVVGLGEV